MGIKHLWTILSPYAEKKPIYELVGKKIAVDLAGWVCESLNAVDYFVHSKAYLRTLFFRINYLLLNGIIPIFVLEGDAPTLKYDVMSKRNELQFRGSKPRNKETSTKSTNSKPSQGRTRFNYVLKQCEELISALGLSCVKGTGEAEAYCAFLNKENLVDGVLTQDSDCFAYGARKVYRNFSISQQGGATTGGGGSVDVYDLDKICKIIDIGRNKIVILALLCGSDYCSGVDGIGKDTVLKFFNEYKDEHILKHIKSWRDKNTYYTDIEMKVDNKNICVNCGHLGRVQSHTKNGCPSCKSHRGCDDSLWQEKRLSLKAELQIRKKALINPNFPSEEILNEYLQEPSKVEYLNLTWNQPKLIKFVKKLSSLMQWEEIYSFQKIFPILTRWQLLQTKLNFNEIIKPEFIKKKRTFKGIPSYEIVWDKSSKMFECLIPDEQIQIFLNEHIDGLDSLYSTVEPKVLVEKLYPDLVSEFELSKVMRKTKTKRKIKDTPARKKKSIKALSSSRSSASILKDIVNVVSGKNRKLKKKVKGGQTDLLKYFTTNSKDKSYLYNLSQLDLSDGGELEMTKINLSNILNDFINCEDEPIKFKGKTLIFEKFKFTSTPKVLNKISNRVKRNSIKTDSENYMEINEINKSLENMLFTTNTKTLERDLHNKNLAKKYQLEIHDLINHTQEFEIKKTHHTSFGASFELDDYVPLSKEFAERFYK